MCFKRVLFVVSAMLIVSSCAMFRDFLAPSDLVNAIEKRDGVRIADISVPDRNVKNNDTDIFTVYCTTESQYDVTNVVVDAQNIGKGFVGMVPNFAEPNKCSLTLTVSSNTKAGSTTLSITAYNNMGYTTTEIFTITVEEINAYYVATNGNDTNIGATNAPFATIQYAIQKANLETVKKVYVSAGVYTNRYNNDEYCLSLIDGVAIYGGYNYSDGYINQDIANNPTIIDGKQTAQHVVLADQIFDTEAGLDGFVITGGKSDTTGGGLYLNVSSVFVKNCIISNNSATYDGGAIMCVVHKGTIASNKIINNTADNGGGVFFFSTPTNCKFINNILITNIATNDGGAIHAELSPLLIANNTISNNNANYGGGMYLNKSSSAMINNTISNNSAKDGGGMYLNKSSPAMTNNTISYNSASQNGGGMALYSSSSPVMTANTISYNSADFNGAGMALYSSSSPVMTSNTINSNSATAGVGGGMALYFSSSPEMTANTIIHNSADSGGGMYLTDSSSPAITGNTISSNSAKWGGGMYLELSSPIMTGNTISYNNANTWNGGGMFLSSSSPAMTNNTIIHNSADSGGGMSISGTGSSPIITDNTINSNSASSDGGGIYLSGSSPTITGNTIRYNSATNGGGMCIISYSTNTNIQNLILDNWASNSNVIFISGTITTPVFISNIIGSTNNDTNHYAIWENSDITTHTLQYNFFVSDVLGFLYYDSANGSTNDIVAVNDTGWTGAEAGSVNNMVIDYTSAMAMWVGW